MSKYIIIPIIFTSTIVYGDNQKFNEYAIFCEKMIVTLQSCTDEKSTFSHSSEFPIILYTVLNENPLKDFFKSQKGALYHIMLLAEIERLNHHKWFNLSSMKNHVNQIKSKNTLCNGIEDPSSAVSAKEKIINYVNNLNDNKSKNNLVSYNGWLKIENNTLVNERKEKIRLKGISTHGLQWYSKYANYDMMKSLKEELGINLFRIAMYTEENGYIYNKSLKNKVEEIVENAKKLDMYVIIDWHILSDGDPMIHKEEAKEFFREMSLKYKDYPNVIYEICNEPNGNVTWENNIKPYAEEVIKEIRENSKKSIIIVGTPTWSQEVDKPVKNKINDEQVMYALHFYSGTHTEWLRERVKEALKDIPIFVSEWGVSDASGNGGVYKEETIKWINFMKENNLSYAVWSLSDKNESSALLIPGPSENKIIDDNLSEAGKFIKSVIKD